VAAGRGVARNSKAKEVEAPTGALALEYAQITAAFNPPIPERARRGLTPLTLPGDTVHHAKTDPRYRDRRAQIVKRVGKGWKPTGTYARYNSVKAFCKQLEWIEQNWWIVTKQSRRVLLRFNTVQELIVNHVAWCAANLVPVRLIIPKARQEGVSTVVQALIAAKVLWSDGYTGAVISHDESSVGKIFGKTRTFFRYLDSKWNYRHQLVERKQAKFRWAHESEFRVNSIKTGDGLEMGGTLNAVHGSEVANWSDRNIDAYQAWVSVSEAIPARDPNSMVFFESTAKGQDPFFHPLVEQARKGQNNFHLLFLPWFLMPDYVMPWKEFREERQSHGHEQSEYFVATEEEHALREKVRGDIGKLDDQNRELFRYHLTELSDEQLIWRRYKIHFEMNGRISDFHRYYPSWLEQAFSASAECFFPGAVLERLKTAIRPASMRGDVIPTGEGGAIEFQQIKTGGLQVWSEPVPGESYVIGADVASASVRGDFSCATVVTKDAKKVVAVFHGKVDPDHFGEYLTHLGYYYNNAYLVIERNYAPTCAKVAARLGYAPMYWFKDEVGFAKHRGLKPGFSTNVSTRNMVLTAMQQAFRDDLDHPDKEFLYEALAFVHNGKKGSAGKYEAAGGRHDDRVMSVAFALYCCLAAEKEERERKPDAERSLYDVYLANEDYLRKRKRFLAGQRGDGKVYL